VQRAQDRFLQEQRRLQGAVLLVDREIRGEPNLQWLTMVPQPAETETRRADNLARAGDTEEPTARGTERVVEIVPAQTLFVGRAVVRGEIAP
jgi:hypothetical protein